jgi:hypothetical protein
VSVAQLGRIHDSFSSASSKTGSERSGAFAQLVRTHVLRSGEAIGRYYARRMCILQRKFGGILGITAEVFTISQDHVVYDSFNGIVLAAEEGKNIAKAIGNNKAALLQNHGILTVGETIEAAVFWFMSMEKCCHSQLMADAAAAGRGGATIKIDEEDAQFTYNTIGTPAAGWFSAKPMFDLIHKETGGDYLE